MQVKTSRNMSKNFNFYEILGKIKITSEYGVSYTNIQF